MRNPRGLHLNLSLLRLGSAFALLLAAFPTRAQESVEEFTQELSRGPAAEDLSIDPAEMMARLRREDSDRFLELFSPLRSENAALAPDGRHLAFSRREGAKLHVIIVDLERPSEAKAKTLVGTDEAATPFLVAQRKELVPARIEWMGWVSPSRLAIQTNQSFANERDGHWRSVKGALLAINADGTGGGTVFSPMDAQRIDPIDQQEGRDQRHPRLADDIHFGEWTYFRPGIDDEQRYDYEWGEIPRDSILLQDPFVTVGINEPERILIDQPSDVFLGSTRQEHSWDFDPVIQPQSLQVVDFDPDDRYAVLVRAGPLDDYEVWSVNLLTGDEKTVASGASNRSRSVLLDRQHRTRISILRSTRSRFPHDYQYDAPKTFFRWQDLDKMLSAAGRFKLSPENVFGQREIPLGFDENPDILYYASDVDRSTFGVYALQLSTGKRTDLAIEHPDFDLVPPLLHGFEAKDAFVFDRFTRQLLGIRFDGVRRSTIWFNPSWRQLQQNLEEHFAGRNVEILEWSEERDVFLLRVSSPTDAGGYQVFDLKDNTSIDIVRRAPEIDEGADAWPLSFSFQRDDDWLVHGRLLLPARPIAKPIPLVFLCASTPWQRVPTQFDREALALARMGYVVVQLNQRGAWGFGYKHRAAIRDGFEATQAGDILATIDHLKVRYAVDPNRVAIVGQDLGGYLALRTIQLHGERFKCGIAVNTPLDPGTWLSSARWADDEIRVQGADLFLIQSYLGGKERLRHPLLLDDAEAVARPLQIFSFRAEERSRPEPDYRNAVKIARTIRKKGTPVEIHELHEDYIRNLPAARAEVFQKIERFLFEHMFSYSVEIGELEYLDENDS